MEGAPIEKLFPELAQFGPEDYLRIGTDRPALMIAMTARTGSSHLCSALASVLPVGNPKEILNGRDTLVWEKQKANVERFEEFLRLYFASSEKIIVFKTSWGDFSYFGENIFKLFRDLRVVYLSRLDVEAQAVSLFKAIATGHWHDTPSIRPGKKLSEQESSSKFDLLRICKLIASLEAEKNAWEDFFFRHEMQPARVNYESFQADLGMVVRMIASHLGLGDVDAGSVRSEFRALSDSVNELWLNKVRNYRNGNFYRRYAAGELPPVKRN